MTTTTTYGTTESVRNADLASVAKLLTEQRTRALDIVTPATAITAHMGRLMVAGADGVIDADGVTPSWGTYSITGSAEAQLAYVLKIPLQYMRTMHATAVDLWDRNVNGWLVGIDTSAADQFRAMFGDDVPETYPGRAADPRKFLLRLVRGDVDGRGVVRAVLSDSYKPIDNLDVLMATLQGIQDSGADVHIDGADLTERRMYVRVSAPGVTALAPVLTESYRSPFRPGGATRLWGNDGDGPSLPIMFAGFVVSNSETGQGKFSITPRITLQICTNGMTINADAASKIHVGSKLDEGVIRWADDTREAQIELIKKQARDAVTTFLSPEYLADATARVEAAAGAIVTDAPKAIEIVAQKFAFDQSTADALLSHFILGGQMTSGGVGNAMTSVAQTLDDGDDANRLESKAFEAMELVAAIR
jgi:hypothetical protein